MPRTAFMGIRSSWDVLARKVDLASAIASAQPPWLSAALPSSPEPSVPPHHARLSQAILHPFAFVNTIIGAYQKVKAAV